MRSLLCLVAACSSPSHQQSAPDANQPGDADMIGPQPLGPLMPRETANNHTAVMTAPTVVAITYDGDPNRADTEAFFQQYAASPAWALQVGEYGVGALTVGTPRHLSGPAATSDAALRQILTTNLGGTSPAWGAPNESTLYSFTLPVGTKFKDQTGAAFCGGFHDDVMIGSVDVAYSYQLPCSFPPPITATQVLTFTLAHELVEGVTDPRWEHDPAWGNVDAAHAVWSYITDGELGDLCEFTDTFLWADPPNMTYAVQRIWSNAAARAGTDPCIGNPASAYYQSVPAQPDDVTISLFGGSAATKGLKVAVGATGMLELHVAGTPGSGPFQVTAVDVASLFQLSTTPLLKLTQPSGTFEIGDTVTIPVTVMAKDANLGGEAFEIDTKPVNGGPTTYFYGVIGQ
jgi:hypothetical protein